MGFAKVPNAEAGRPNLRGFNFFNVADCKYLGVFAGVIVARDLLP